MNQEIRVLDYMRTHRGITSLEAFNELGVTRLSAKIFALKKSGNTIVKEREESLNRWGEKTHYDRYFLVED